MLVRRQKTGIDIFQQGLFGRLPKSRVVAEGAIILLPRSDDFLMGKGSTVGQTMHCVGYADRVIQHTERIHQGIEAHATAKCAHFIGEAGTQEEQTVAIGDGLLQRLNLYFCMKNHLFSAKNLSTSIPAMAPVPAATMA